MGRLRSKTNAVKTVNGVALGEPVIADAGGNPPVKGDTITELFFTFDDPRLPNGLLNADGSVTLDPEPLP